MKEVSNMKGYPEEVLEGSTSLSKAERERLDARYRVLRRGAADLRRVADGQTEPLWAAELEASP